MSKLDGTDDFFDTREVLERIEELKTEYENEDGDLYLQSMSTEDEAEYSALIALQEAAEGYVPDFFYGETFYSLEYFRETYAEEMTREHGYIGADLPDWITNNIDWDGVADDLLEDYTEFDFHGTTYVAR